MFGFDIPLWAAALGSAAITAGASAYNTSQTNSANSAIASAAQSFDLGTFREANDFNRAQADLTRWYNSEEAVKAREFSAQQASAQQTFNAGEAQKTRDFQERMSNTQYQRAIGDMKSAGLNPMLAYSQGGAGNVGGATASGAAASGPAASAGGASSAGAPRAHTPQYAGAPLAAGASSALGAITAATQLSNLEKQGNLLDAQRDQVVAQTGTEKQREIELGKSNQWLSQQLEERLNAAKFDNSMKNIANRMSLELEDFRKDMVKESWSQEKIHTRLMELDEKYSKLGLPKAQAESDFYSSVGPAAKYAAMLGDVLGIAGSARSLVQRRPGRSYSETFYDRHGVESGGRSRTYQD